MEKHKTQKVTGDGGSIILENISQNPSQAYFKVTVEVNPKSFIQRLTSLFSSSSAAQETFYVDRIAAKHASNYLHNHITAADKVYKAENPKVSTSAPKMSAESKKKTYKPRKPKTTEDTKL